MYLFKVRVVHPANTVGNDRTWKHNAKYNVLAPTTEIACQDIRHRFPEVRILSVYDLGKVDFVS